MLNKKNIKVKQGCFERESVLKNIEEWNRASECEKIYKIFCVKPVSTHEIFIFYETMLKENLSIPLRKMRNQIHIEIRQTVFKFFIILMKINS